jgi:hypothetical protein
VADRSQTDQSAPEQSTVETPGNNRLDYLRNNYRIRSRG